jgi:hypothetical protein
LRTNNEAFGRRFGFEEPLRIAIEVGTHSPRVSRLLKDYSHEFWMPNSRRLRLL